MYHVMQPVLTRGAFARVNFFVEVSIYTLCTLCGNVGPIMRQREKKRCECLASKSAPGLLIIIYRGAGKNTSL